MFQSLFLWNSLNGDRRRPRGCRRSFNPCFCGIRSAAAAHRRCGSTSRGFNPCFCGIRSAAGQRTQPPDMSRFQSLFLWNSLSGVIAAGVAGDEFGFQSLFLWNSLNGGLARRYMHAGEFQSLFLWNSLNGNVPAGHVCRPSRVSILVFVEFAQRRGPPRGHAADSDRSFNPCFCGIRSTAATR